MSKTSRIAQNSAYAAIFVICLTALSACLNGGTSSPNAAVAHESCGERSIETKHWRNYYCYSYKDNSCTTGKREFPSYREYCEGLVNEALNDGCAYNKRTQVYLESCSTI